MPNAEHAPENESASAPLIPGEAPASDTRPDARPGAPPDAPPGVSDGFASLGLAPELEAALTALGYEEPTPIQREAIPPLLAGRDLLGQAATGTGKTAAFALPMIQRCVRGAPRSHKPRGFVLVPTRELAMQVAEAIHRYGKPLGTTVLAIYGGQPFGMQLRSLERGVEIVVATPGRAVDHLERGTLQLDEIEMLVLDEADEMLDMGFAEDLDKLLSRAKAERQTALFSATLAPRILSIAERHLRNPLRVSIERERARAGEVPRVRQVAYLVPRPHKPVALGRVLDMESPTSAIVFCRTRLEVDQLQDAMAAHGYRAAALHGGFAQVERDRVMARFRAGTVDLLIATDVAARGLDIQHVSHVFNYDVPTEPDAYVHRIGRTGRAGREGSAITFVEPRERRLLYNIERATGQRIVPATIPTVAELKHRRLELTRTKLRETVAAGELETYRALVDELATELDPLDVAAAAVRLAHESEHSAARSDEKDVLAPAPQQRQRGPDPSREQRPFEPGGPQRGPEIPLEAQQRPRPEFRRPREDFRAPREDFRGPREDFRGPRGDFRAPRGPSPGGVRLFIGAGTAESLRPKDLVGAITNETGLTNAAIGPIEIRERFSLVEVAEEHAERIMRALRSTKLRGRRVLVRLDREGGNPY
jgi:ATP-dependent RNA helicase DeaD